ncbi:MAG: cyclic nucleotide-binding domain-containing protein [Ectothiorhodospiraceae bacterium]|nr:cyclic nucleotide-binding domain-containing protein [Ectothiorhodospiraceae bacterium]
MDHVYQVAVIGAGPAGLSAAARAARCGMDHVLLERGTDIADTVRRYQRGKLVMSAPSALPLRSDLDFAAGAREQVLAAWQDGVGRTGINLRTGAEVLGIDTDGGTFTVKLRGAEPVRAEKVVLAIGLQGNIRRLTIPGAEDFATLQYELEDPQAHAGETIVVVGAGDAAIENALALAEANQVAIVNRRDEFARAKSGNLAAITEAIDRGAVECYWSSTPERLEDGALVLRTPHGEARVACDRVIARLGATPPRAIVEACGVRFPSDDPTALPTLGAAYESNVPGLHVIGALSGYPLIKQAMNQGYEVIEHLRGNHALRPADEPLLEERLRGAGGTSVEEVLARIQRRIPLLADLNPLMLRELMLDSDCHALAPGERIFERNDYSDSFYAVLDGSVRIELDPETVLDIPTGDYFGEMGLISGRRRSARASAGPGGAVVVETNRRAMVKLINTAREVREVLDATAVVRHVQTYLAPYLSKAELADVVATSRIQTYEQGQSLFAEGEPGDSLHLVRRGSVTVSKRIAEHEVVLGYLPAGSYVGEMALVSESPRGATVRAAVNATETIRIDGAAFKRLLATEPRLRNDIEEKLRERATHNERLAGLPEASSIVEFLLRQGLGEATDVLLIDESLCIRCDNCETACARTHGGISRLDRESGPRFATLHVPTSCRHCEHPHCMADCPPDAIHRSAGGEVFIDDACIGCGNCVRNCPYGVIRLAAPRPARPSLLDWLRPWRRASPPEGAAETAKVAVKCDMCATVPGGPACVRACPTGAAARVRPEEFFRAVVAS